MYSLLESYELQKHQLQSRPQFETVVSTQHNTQHNGQLSGNLEVNKVKNADKRRSPHQRFLLPGTGRIAFGTSDDVGEIYHYLNQVDKAKQKTNVIGDELYDSEEIKFQNLTLKPEPANPTRNEKSHVKSELVVPPSSRKNKNPPNDPEKPSKKQNISVAEPVEPQHGEGTVKIPSQRQPSGNKTNHPHGIHTGNKTSNGKNDSSSVGVGQTSGKAAAMARMKALGEEWPEEEDLPGFAANPSSLSSQGLPTKDVVKEANKSLQRQQKVNIAKRKT